MSFELAIKAGIPIISVQTNDLVNLVAVLGEITENLDWEHKPIKQYIGNARKLEHGVLYYFTHELTSAPEVYKELVLKESILVVVNPKEPNTSFYDAGILPTPHSLVYDFLSDQCEMTGRQAKSLIPALGGLSLKQITDVLMLTQASTGGSEITDIIRTRQLYLNRAQGLEIVDTDLTGYLPRKDLHLCAQDDKTFFLGDYDQRLRPRGLLAYGSPGTGKSMGAKYLAREWGVPLFKLDAGIQSRWVGESEANLTAALRQIEMMAPAILMIDEVEKLFASASDGGVTSKLLGGLLWWMQEHRAKVFTYMTCNLISSIPPELYRPGRIDRTMMFQGLAQKEAGEFAAQAAASYKGIAPPKQVIMKYVNGLYDGAEPGQRVSQADIQAAVITAIKKHMPGKKR